MIAHLIQSIKLDYIDKIIYPIIAMDTCCDVCFQEFKVTMYHRYGCLHLTKDSIGFSSCDSDLRSGICFRDNILEFFGSQFMQSYTSYSYVYLMDQCEFMSGYDYTCRKLKYE